ncbi:MAG: hypothetical protein ABIH86_01740 [Planctomycetota bacterium]
MGIRTRTVESKKLTPEREKEVFRHLFSATIDIAAGGFWSFLSVAVILNNKPKTMSNVFSSLPKEEGVFVIICMCLFLLTTYLGIKNLYYFYYKSNSETKTGVDDLTHADSIETDGWDESADDNPKIAAINKTVIVTAVIITSYVLLFLLFFYHIIFN